MGRIFSDTSSLLVQPIGVFDSCLRRVCRPRFAVFKRLASVIATKWATDTDTKHHTQKGRDYRVVQKIQRHGERERIYENHLCHLIWEIGVLISSEEHFV